MTTKNLMAPQADLRMRKDVGLLLIECPVTCCDVLNQDDSRPSVGSTQLMRFISNLLISHNRCDWAIAEKYLLHLLLELIVPPVIDTPTFTLNIVIEAFGNHSSNLAMSLLQFVSASTHTL